jgi:hypothetical protein
MFHLVDLAWASECSAISLGSHLLGMGCKHNAGSNELDDIGIFD